MIVLTLMCSNLLHQVSVLYIGISSYETGTYWYVPSFDSNTYIRTRALLLSHFKHMKNRSLRDHSTKAVAIDVQLQLSTLNRCTVATIHIGRYAYLQLISLYPSPG